MLIKAGMESPPKMTRAAVASQMSSEGGAADSAVIGHAAKTLHKRAAEACPLAFP